MGIGFNQEEEVEEEYVPLYRTVIECNFCGDDTLMNVYKGYCQCGNLYISVKESASKVRHKPESKWTHFKTVHYRSEPPLIYEVLIADEE
tara:strand:+ start:225 stop:494 length:270 start_codon:yes stop_codon:yes gene_type:complete